MPLRYLRGICFGNGAEGGVTVNRVGADPVKINDTCIGVFGGIRFAGLATKIDRYCGRMALGMPPRTFKRWLNTSLFKKITYGFYEKKYR